MFFQTTELWGVTGSDAPYGHRGDIDNFLIEVDPGAWRGPGAMHERPTLIWGCGPHQPSLPYLKTLVIEQYKTRKTGLVFGGYPAACLTHFICAEGRCAENGMRWQWMCGFEEMRRGGTSSTRYTGPWEYFCLVAALPTFDCNGDRLA